MNITFYVCSVKSTLGSSIDLSVISPDAYHALLGIFSEVGEIVETIRNSIIYNNPLDIDNISEEIGDTMFYIVALCIDFELDLLDILESVSDNLYSNNVEKPISDLNSISNDFYCSLLGIFTEAGKVSDYIKKNIAYGKVLDIKDISKSIEQILFYIIELCDTFNFSIANILEENHKKRMTRYPQGFSKEHAILRLDKK